MDDALELLCGNCGLPPWDHADAGQQGGKCLFEPTFFGMVPLDASQSCRDLQGLLTQVYALQARESDREDRGRAEWITDIAGNDENLLVKAIRKRHRDIGEKRWPGFIACPECGNPFGEH